MTCALLHLVVGVLPGPTPIPVSIDSNTIGLQKLCRTLNTALYLIYT